MKTKISPNVIMNGTITKEQLFQQRIYTMREEYNKKRVHVSTCVINLIKVVVLVIFVIASILILFCFM